VLTKRTMPSLERVLTVRAVLIALAISVLLLAFFFAKYMIDTPHLRRATLQAEVDAIVQALPGGENPARWPQYRDYPNAYAFRVFERRGPPTRQLLASANQALLPLAGPAGRPASAADLDLTEGIRTLAAADGTPIEDGWMLTDHQDVAGHSYWAQVVMIGDPGWRWRTVIADEMMGHVVVPVLSIAPALTLAMLLSTRIALRPLRRIARQAAALGVAAGTGGRLTPLDAANLPLEFNAVVVAMNAMLARLERTLLLQKQFTSDAAHELRTPLAVLLLQIAELPPGPTVDAIRGELQGLGALVGQLLQLAQAEDAADAERRVVDLAGLARKVCEELAPVALARQQVIEFDAPEAAVPVSGHAALIETALRNLVDNALKYAPAGTAVAVGVDATVRVTVEDRGPGVRDEHKELVFNRFWRADRQRLEGAGIGLALVRRIAQLHGGDVHVEDRPGGGARFVLTLAPWRDG
jgi:signal transduction histidine kinase